MYDAFVWARSALNIPKRRFAARAEAQYALAVACLEDACQAQSRHESDLNEEEGGALPRLLAYSDGYSESCLASWAATTVGSYQVVYSDLILSRNPHTTLIKPAI